MFSVATSSTRMIVSQLSDCHCHISLDPERDSSTTPDGEKATPHRLVVCGTHPTRDWQALAALASAAVSAAPELVVGFGLHPWWVPAVEEEGEHKHTAAIAAIEEKPWWLVELEQHLRRYPHAMVGEIGLDKLRGPSEEVQVDAFHRQLRLAATYSRPVSVHCVRHYGRLVEMLQSLPAEWVPPTIILHAFTGSYEIAHSLLRLRPKKRSASAAAGRTEEPREPIKIAERIFFSINASTSGRVKDFRGRTLPYLLKEGRVLLETDAEHCVGGLRESMAQPEVWLSTDAQRSLVSALEMVVEALDGDEALATRVLEDTYKRAFGCLKPINQECGGCTGTSMANIM